MYVSFAGTWGEGRCTFLNLLKIKKVKQPICLPLCNHVTLLTLSCLNIGRAGADDPESVPWDQRVRGRSLPRPCTAVQQGDPASHPELLHLQYELLHRTIKFVLARL
jgi:hypothetical protein